MKINWKRLIVNLAVPLAAGGLATLLSGGMGAFDGMVQPPLSPPGWVFPVVWTILYLLMGYAAYRVQTADPENRDALIFYGLQLLFNFLWPIVFFRFEAYLAAFLILVVLLVLILITLQRFYNTDQTAGKLLIPYLLWVGFAGYLNFGVYLLN